MSRLQLVLLVTLTLTIGCMMLSSLPSASAPAAAAVAASRAPVVVIGSGLAGLSAAMEAVNAGQRVHMLERAARPGGNSRKASSGINGVPTPHQPAGDSIELFKNDTIRSAGRRYVAERSSLIKTLAEESAAAIAWLEGLGVDLSHVARLGGHSAARTHRGASGPPPGAALVTALLRALEADERFTLTTGADVTGVEREERAERGPLRVCFDSPDGPACVRARAVVWAAGGFAGDGRGLLGAHRPDLAALPSTNDARAATAHALLAAAGARLVDMDAVQVHPTGFVDPRMPAERVKVLAAEALRGEGGILLRGGARFANELATREALSAAIMARPPTNEDGRQWDVTLLLDPGASAAAAAHVDFYAWRGLLRRVRVRDLDAATQAAVAEYAAAVERGEDKLGRTSFGSWSLKPGDTDALVYVGRVTPVTHFTMGGAVIDREARVLDANGAPIPHLFAAGEITGGLHGDNRLGGSSLLECVVYGRIAGQNAAKPADHDA